MIFDLTTLLVTTVVILVVYTLWYRRDDPRLPPTPVKPWPLLGNLIHLEKNPRKQFIRWRKQVGDLYSIFMGPQRVIMVTGHEYVKEAFIKNSNISSERPFFLFDQASGSVGNGVIFSSGSIWKEQREVTMSILRSLGMGKNILAERIMEISEDLVSALAGLKGKPTDIEGFLTTAVSNVICSLVIGHRFKFDDDFFHKTIHNMKGNLRDGGNICVPNFLPFLQYFPFDLFRVKESMARGRFIMDIIVKQFIQRREKELREGHSAENYIATYLTQRDRKEKSGVSTTLDEVNLRKNIYDLFIAGTETVSITLLWAVLHLLHNPAMQDKLHQEMEREVGTERPPNMHDMAKLTYLNAFVYETQRLGSIVPFSVLYKTVAEMKLGKYTLPEGSILLQNLDSVLWDEETWGQDAATFRPERFIGDDGKIKVPEAFIPFSVGKRICAGEAMAKMELFLFFSALIQRFKFVPVDPAAIPPLTPIEEFGFTTPPEAYEVRVLDRTLMAGN